MKMYRFDESEIIIDIFRHRDVVVVRITHQPTGIFAEIDNARSHTVGVSLAKLQLDELLRKHFKKISSPE